MRKGFSIKSKLIFILLLISILSVLVIGYLGWRTNRDTVTKLVFDQLTAVRHTKATQLEAYFHDMRNQVEVLSDDTMLIDAMINLGKTFRALNSQTISAEMDKGLETFYTTQFFPKLFANLPGQAEYTLYRPTTPAGAYLQYQYIQTVSGQKAKYKTVFEPGYTTKQRGWGLGLSLTKRIIENYHSGKIFVKNSEIDKGTCFRIVLNK